MRRDSPVGITNRYGLDGPGIESWWGRDFPQPSRPALWYTQPPIQWVPGLSRVKPAGAWRWPPTPSSAKVKERVEQYIYSTFGPSWPVIGWTLPSLFTVCGSRHWNVGEMCVSIRGGNTRCRCSQNEWAWCGVLLENTCSKIRWQNAGRISHYAGESTTFWLLIARVSPLRRGGVVLKLVPESPDSILNCTSKSNVSIHSVMSFRLSSHCGWFRLIPQRMISVTISKYRILGVLSLNLHLAYAVIGYIQSEESECFQVISSAYIMRIVHTPRWGECSCSARKRKIASHVFEAFINVQNIMQHTLFAVDRRLAGLCRN
jgi:hypothetical protein